MFHLAALSSRNSTRLGTGALLVLLVAASVPVYAGLTVSSFTDCGFGASTSHTAAVGTASSVDNCSGAVPFPSTTTWHVIADASASATTTADSILKARASVNFDGLELGNLGANRSNAAIARATARYSDVFFFSVADAGSRASGYTLHTELVLNGLFDFDVATGLFTDGSAALSGLLTASNLGAALPGQSGVSITQTLTGTTGRTGRATYQKNILVNDPAGLTVALELQAIAQFFNNATGQPGVGTGSLTSAFDNTAGIASFAIFDSTGQAVDFNFSAQSGRFAFYDGPSVQPPAGPGTVPTPGSAALSVAALAALAWVRRRR